MLNKLLGISTLEDSEPIELEEVPMDMAPQIPDEYDHDTEPGIDYEADPFSVLSLEEGGE